ncbi:MAG TPA: hypothetical protein VGL59_12175 [Polyangia bacterium]|jgi:hypothetical protein
MSKSPAVVFQTESLTVVDDLLPADAVDALWNYFQLQSFQRVDALGMQGQWALEDSGVLRGPTTGWQRRWDAQYPTKTPIDAAMKAVVDNAPLFAATAGRRDADWNAFSAFPTIYVAGQGRLWHRDGDDETGSWTYFAHPQWNIEWGGELFVAAERELLPASGVFLHRLRPMTDHADPPPWKSHLDNDDANRALLEDGTGVGSFVAPKPNRLVVVNGAAPRSMAKVRASAGRHAHASLGGVFKKTA